MNRRAPDGAALHPANSAALRSLNEYRYFSTSTTYLRAVLTALSRWGARSIQAFDL
jgi:hypothetical protein